MKRLIRAGVGRRQELVVDERHDGSGSDGEDEDRDAAEHDHGLRAKSWVRPVGWCLTTHTPQSIPPVAAPPLHFCHDNSDASVIKS